MKHTLNAAGQAAIVQFLENVGCTRRPWTSFDSAEHMFNSPLGPGNRWLKVQPDDMTATPALLTLEPDWFDTAPEPATFDEVVAMLRAIHAMWSRPAGAAGRIITRQHLTPLLDRCPKPNDTPSTIPRTDIVGIVKPPAPLCPAGFEPWGPGWMPREPFAHWPAGLKKSDQVEVRLRNGSGFTDAVQGIGWEHAGISGDVVAYRKL